MDDKTSLETRISDIYSHWNTGKDGHKLMEALLLEAVAMTHCDGGTIYEIEDNQLHFRIMKTISKDFFINLWKDPSQQEKFPPLPMSNNNACAYCAMTKRIVNIDDVYNSAYDFTGAKDHDQKNQYKTVSMLMYPLENDLGEVVAVVQLINALDLQGEITPFSTSFHELLQSIFQEARTSFGVFGKKNMTDD